MNDHFPSLFELDVPEAWRQTGTWISIGTFDGVHRGHQELIKQLVTHAHDNGKLAVLITFFPHPSVVLRGHRGSFYLTSPEERSALLTGLGVDGVITLAFTHELASLSAYDFMEIMKQKFNVEQLLVGYNFALGRGREGDLPTLREIGEKLGYQLQIVSPVEQGQTIISSSTIRTWIAEGSVERAAQALGRLYSLNGIVVQGDGRGRSLGIPTANLEIWEEQAIPANGVYACRAWFGDTRRNAVVNIGIRPTFEAQPVLPRVEAHLLDFSEDIYGQDLHLEFVARLRGEKRFSSIELLLAQITHDKATALEILDKVGAKLDILEAGDGP